MMIYAFRWSIDNTRATFSLRLYSFKEFSIQWTVNSLSTGVFKLLVEQKIFFWNLNNIQKFNF